MEGVGVRVVDGVNLRVEFKWRELERFSLIPCSLPGKVERMRIIFIDLAYLRLIDYII